MNNRIKKLRKASIEAPYKLSAERALLVTSFYSEEDPDKNSIPVQRALCFRHIILNKSICINPGELIAGERGPAPKAAPTYPEICLHSLDDLDIISSRKKVAFEADEEFRRVYKDIVIPFWKGRTQRDKIFGNMSSRWLEAYRAGVFTEFQEQRAPGHTVAGKNVFLKGMRDYREEIHEALSRLDFNNDPVAFEKREELKAMDIAAYSLMDFASRYAVELEKLAEKERDPERAKELKDMALICRRVPAGAPSTFHEALQHYWFIHLGVITELNPWDSFNPGRLDRHLYPFYRKEIDSGTLTRERAKELLQSFWIKFNNHPSPPKTGVTAQESNTYSDFTLINAGGVNEDGSDAVNELSYLILDVIEEMRLIQPGTMVQISKKNPDTFVKRALEVVKTGFGQPSLFNTDAIIQQLLSQGKSITDARNGGASGCVETGAFGTEAYILTGYFNLNKILEITLNNGTDPATGKKTGIKTGDPSSFKSFHELYEAFEKQLEYFASIKTEGNNIIEKLYSLNMPAPLLSVITEDCIRKGRDYNSGGARYNTRYIQGVGLGSITDNLASICFNVFDERSVTMKVMLKALKANFKRHEELRHNLVYQTPKWGNNDDYADRFAVMVFNSFYNAVNGKLSSCGGTFRINLLPTTCHVYFGSVTGAMPDGRLSGQPLSEGISPVQGADTKGPTAVIMSAAKIDHIKTGGTLLNQKFSPSFFSGSESIDKMVSLVRTYFRLDGHHVQFNVTDAKTLRDAKKNPEKYRDLIVRVAGYSDYFNDLGETLQDEIIRRTEHSGL